MNLEIANPFHGAAFQVLYARTAPQLCLTRERQAEIKADFDAVMAWAATQSAGVHGAYRWATQTILSEIDRAMARNELGRTVAAALETMPKPPEITK